MKKDMNKLFTPEEGLQLLILSTNYEKKGSDSVQYPRCNGRIVVREFGNSYEVECLPSGIKSGSREL